MQLKRKALNMEAFLFSFIGFLRFAPNLPEPLVKSSTLQKINNYLKMS